MSNSPAKFEVNSENLGKVEVIHRDCPQCQRNNTDQPDLKNSYDVWTLKQCLDCGFVYIDKGPDYSKLFAELSWEVTTKVEEKRRAVLRPVAYKYSKLSRFRLHVLPRKKFNLMVEEKAEPGPVIDIGCGQGGDIAKLPASYIPYGIEISTEWAQVANDRFSLNGGQCINAPTLEGLKSFEDNFFTAATARSYLEHEMNPLEVLIELYRVMKPGGVVIIKVPNYGSLNRIFLGHKWCGLRYPDHLNYFTTKTLRKMGETAGFNASYGFAYKLPTSDNMYLDLIKPK